MYKVSCQQFASGTISQLGWKAWTTTPKEFWKNIQHSFEAATEILNNLLAERGINLTDVAPDIWEKREGEISSIHSRAWTYLGWAKLYGEKVFLWEALQAQGNQLVIEEYKEYKSVITYYQHYIFAKLNRVASLHEYHANSQGDEEVEREILLESQKALLAINRSLGAWNFLCSFHKEDLQPIFDLMVLMVRIKYHMLNNFPQLMETDFPIFYE
ncbi:MAG: hypothetical protein AAF694_30240 [Bacteroidota bacterium]